MNLQEFVEAKRVFEWDLRALIQAEVRKFEEATGQSPSDIAVRLVREDIIGRTNPKHIVDSVKVDVALE